MANERADVPPAARRPPYLIDSRWPIEGLTVDRQVFAFQVQGFGPDAMTWKVEEAGRYQMIAKDGDRAIDSFAEAGAGGLLTFTLRTRRYAPAKVTVRRISGS